MYTFNYKDELYHYGVLGMKWGVRRYQPYGEGGYMPKDRRRRRYEKKREKALNSKNAKQLYENRQYLTTEELKERSERFILEKQLKDISDSDTSVGKKIATETMVEVGKTALKIAAIAGVAYAVSKTDTGKEILMNAKNVYSVAKKATELAGEKADVVKDVTQKVAKVVTNPTDSLKDVRTTAAQSDAGKAYVNTINNTIKNFTETREAAANSDVGKAYVENMTKVLNTEPVKQVRKDVRNVRTSVAKSDAAKKYVKAVNRIIKK